MRRSRIAVVLVSYSKVLTANGITTFYEFVENHSEWLYI